eukprot:359740-Chlamydomonas_euryale.AAC.12
MPCTHLVRPGHRGGAQSCAAAAHPPPHTFMPSPRPLPRRVKPCRSVSAKPTVNRRWNYTQKIRAGLCPEQGGDISLQGAARGARQSV